MYWDVVGRHLGFRGGVEARHWRTAKHFLLENLFVLIASLFVKGCLISTS